jgi:hypothetical protein
MRARAGGPLLSRDYDGRVNRQQLLERLHAGDFDALIGEAESAEIDFKREPYRLDEPAQAFELAKDVAALANIEPGGLLVVGFWAPKLEGADVEVVESVHVFARAMFNRDAWLDKAQQLIYPTVVGLDAVFKPSGNDPARGVAVISVPPQRADSRYFLVAKEFISDDGAPGWMIGVSVRSADRNRALRVEEVHALVSRGTNTGAQFDEIRTLVTEIHSAVIPEYGAAQAEAAIDALQERIDRAAQRLGR